MASTYFVIRSSQQDRKTRIWLSDTEPILRIGPKSGQGKVATSSGAFPFVLDSGLEFQVQPAPRILNLGLWIVREDGQVERPFHLRVPQRWHDKHGQFIGDLGLGALGLVMDIRNGGFE